MPFLLLMPSYNQAHYIVEAVRSVLAQDDPDWELWILDNSSDRTPEAMRAFDDPRIHFHHVPARMDPGTCLNWLLERARGEAFSYVHTDNNLRADYVRRMRAALAGKPMGLAYCDMRTIRGDGSPKEMFRRGPFDLARLLSLDTLGVPFSATTALAQAVGGFKSNDLADDVRFCVSAYGLAEYVYVRDALLDYRVHEQSRTVGSGGWSKIQQSFLSMFAQLQPTLSARGVDAPAALEQAVAERLDDLEWFIEDLWYRKLSRALRPWWTGGSIAEHLFRAGVLVLPGFADAQPPARWLIRDAGGRIAVWPWQVWAARLYLATRRRDLRRLTEKVQQVLLPWAHLTLGADAQRVVLPSADFRSILCARLLEQGLHWTPVLPAGAAPLPGIAWGAATGDERRLGPLARAVPRS